jgi:hypothetical protein
MADFTTRSGNGFFHKFITLFLTITIVGLGVAAYYATQPQDLSDIKGYSTNGKVVGVKDVKTILRNSINRGFPVTLTEQEINTWLTSTLKTKQGGLLGSQVSLDHVWVRLLEGYAEVIMERKVFGFPMTVSMFIKIGKVPGKHGMITQVKLDGGPYLPDAPQPLRGGHFGQLVVPQGFLVLVLPAYAKLSALFTEEKNLGAQSMSDIKIQEGKMILNPRMPLNDNSIILRSF